MEYYGKDNANSMTYTSCMTSQNQETPTMRIGYIAIPMEAKKAFLQFLQVIRQINQGQ